MRRTTPGRLLAMVELGCQLTPVTVADLVLYSAAHHSSEGRELKAMEGQGLVRRVGKRRSASEPARWTVTQLGALVAEWWLLRKIARDEMAFAERRLRSLGWGS